MNRNVTLIATAFFVVFLAVGCNRSGEHTFKSGEPAFMTELKAALTQAGVPYEENADGTIKYKSENAKAFTAVRDQLDRDMHTGVLVRYDDDVSLDYLKMLLTSEGLKFRVEKKKDGEWLRWYPKDKAQEKAMNLKVMEHQIDLEECAKSNTCGKTAAK